MLEFPHAGPDLEVMPNILKFTFVWMIQGRILHLEVGHVRTHKEHARTLKGEDARETSAYLIM